VIGPDTVVYAPFGAHPGGLPGVYEMDQEHISEFLACEPDPGRLAGYLEKYVYSVSGHREYLEQRVGLGRLMELKARATIKEGYR